MNMEDLFNSKEEYITFCNLLAKRRINRIKKENEEYEEEINAALDKCIKIFNKYGEDTDYFAELLDLEDKLRDVEGE